MHMTATKVIGSISVEIRAGKITLHDLYVFMDDLRRGWTDEAVRFHDDGKYDQRAIAIVASVLDVLAREIGRMSPAWIGGITLKEPFFLWAAQSREARMLVMMQTHPAFSQRGVFVPKSIMTRV